jgi:hypothetical protein
MRRLNLDFVVFGTLNFGDRFQSVFDGPEGSGLGMGLCCFLEEEGRDIDGVL